MCSISMADFISHRVKDGGAYVLFCALTTIQYNYSFCYELLRNSTVANIRKLEYNESLLKCKISIIDNKLELVVYLEIKCL